MFLMRAGWTYEILGEYDKALDAYTRIQQEFPKSLQSPEIDKYKERAKILAGQE